MPEDEVPFPSELSDSLIIIRWSTSESRPVFDIGDMDDWSAVTLLRQVVAHLEDGLPYPRNINDPVETDDD